MTNLTWTQVFNLALLAGLGFSVGTFFYKLAWFLLCCIVAQQAAVAGVDLSEVQ